MADTYEYEITGVSMETYLVEEGVTSGRVSLGYVAQPQDRTLPAFTGQVVREFRSDEIDLTESIDVMTLIAGFHDAIERSIDKMYTKKSMADRLLEIRVELNNNILNQGFTYEAAVRDKNRERPGLPIGFHVETKDEG